MCSWTVAAAAACAAYASVLSDLRRHFLIQCVFMPTAGRKWTHAREAAAGRGHIWDEIVSES